VELQRTSVLVMGLARSGRAAALLARRQGADVVAIDLRTELEPIEGVRLELGPHRPEVFDQADLIVVSPGIAAAHPELVRGRAAGKDVVGELGFALRFLRAPGGEPLPVIAITGTNGKSTTTHFTGQLARAAGLRPFVGGNLGTPLCEAALDGGAYDLLILEVSSYQLELPGELCPRVGVILNLTPDHLGRHGTMEGYAAAKTKLFARMGPGDLAVLPAGDERLLEAARGTGGTRAWLGAFPGVVRRGRSAEIQLPGRSVTLDLGGLKVAGEHNLDNAATAALLLLAYGADADALQAALPRLEALDHRMQVVRETHGVAWINDSKATNLDAARVGISGIDRPAVVLLGGQGKPFADGSLGFGALGPVLARHRAVVAFGQDGPRIAAELEATGVRAQVVPSLRDAVEAAAHLARFGDVVLLSPGCASFDEFRDFEHRGTQFAQWVQERFG
jgi:UDP-N-acetylmuramoylalanine--D-glutamate ligase